MRSDTNAIVKSFNAMRGRGLAGVIESIKFDWVDGVNTWETDWNSRAPKFAKVMILLHSDTRLTARNRTRWIQQSTDIQCWKNYGYCCRRRL